MCDFGTGHGLYLDSLLADSTSVYGVEPGEQALETISARLGNRVTVGKTLADLGCADFDVVFHVIEHLGEPIELLEAIRKSLRPGGVFIAEVPHANDVLMRTYDLQAFRDFTFWSEHLILHTRNTLEVFLRAAGFKDVTISGFQRYGLESHLHWLRHQKPGGHVKWGHMANPDLNNAYADMLSRVD